MKINKMQKHFECAIFVILILICQAHADTEKKVDRFFIIMFENRGYLEVVANTVFSNLMKSGVLLQKFYAVHHPSQPNYLAQIGGETFISDDNNHDLDAPNLIDLLEKKGLT